MFYLKYIENGTKEKNNSYNKCAMELFSVFTMAR